MKAALYVLLCLFIQRIDGMNIGCCALLNECHALLQHPKIPSLHPLIHLHHQKTSLRQEHSLPPHRWESLCQQKNTAPERSITRSEPKKFASTTKISGPLHKNRRKHIQMSSETTSPDHFRKVPEGGGNLSRLATQEQPTGFFWCRGDDNYPPTGVEPC